MRHPVILQLLCSPWCSKVYPFTLYYHHLAGRSSTIRTLQLGLDVEKELEVVGGILGDCGGGDVPSSPVDRGQGQHSGGRGLDGGKGINKMHIFAWQEKKANFFNRNF